MALSTIGTNSIADSAVATAKIADDAVGNTKLDLTANYAFTGTITGTPQDLVQVATANMSGTAYGWNSVFSSSYDTYLLTFDNVGSTSSNSHFRFKFYNDTGATSDNKYRGYSFMYHANDTNVSQVYQDGYPYLTVSQYNGTSEGAGGFMWIHQPLQTIMTTFNYQIAFHRSDGYGAMTVGSGNTTDFATRQHTGFYFYLENGGSFGGRAKVTLYGVKRT